MGVRASDSVLLVWPALVVAIALCVVSPVRPDDPCAPESFFLFRSDAQKRLDSLAISPRQNNAFERLVMMHNLAFHGEKSQREKAEKLLEKEFPRKERRPLVMAYAGSLKMIKVSHRTKSGKVLRTLNPLTKSPYSEAREGYRWISEAVALDTSSHILRVLRATAATESAEHLNEMFDSARIDLKWLEANRPASDSVCRFLFHLNWAKYYFKLAKRDGNETGQAEARRHADLAVSFACTPVYQQWAEEWVSKIRKKATQGKSKK